MHIIVFLIILSYLSGSVPWGLIIVKVFDSRDVRKLGSGNIGATNVRRVAGNLPGIFTLTADILKGAIPVVAAIVLLSDDVLWYEMQLSLIGLAAFMGHLYPVFTRFKSGGKGVATAAGVFLILSPPASAVVVIIFVLVTWIGNRVSLGSLAAAACLPMCLWIVTGSIGFTGMGSITTIFIFMRHRSNIKRLMDGTEPGLRDTINDKPSND